MGLMSQLKVRLINLMRKQTWFTFAATNACL